MFDDGFTAGFSARGFSDSESDSGEVEFQLEPPPQQVKRVKRVIPGPAGHPEPSVRRSSVGERGIARKQGKSWESMKSDHEYPFSDSCASILGMDEPQKIPKLAVTIVELRVLNRRALALFEDSTGCIEGTIAESVMLEHVIAVGVTLVVTNVSIFKPWTGIPYLNITSTNISQVYTP